VDEALEEGIFGGCGELGEADELQAFAALSGGEFGAEEGGQEVHQEGGWGRSDATGEEQDEEDDDDEGGAAAHVVVAGAEAVAAAADEEDDEEDDEEVHDVFWGGRLSGGVGGSGLVFGLFVGFDEPEVHVRAAGDFGEDVGGVGVVELGGGGDGGADEFAVERDFMGEFGDVFFAAVDGGGVFGEAGGFSDGADAAMGDATELDDAFGDGVDVAAGG
jgi:hypothetical protein